MSRRDTDPLHRAAARIRAELNAGRLGHAVVILRGFEVEDRERIAELLEVRLTPADAEDLNAANGAPNDRSYRGQALVETALVLPLLLLVIVGGLLLGLAMFDRQSRTWEAQEAAQAAATAGAEDSACDAAIAAYNYVSGRSAASCTGPELRMDYAPPTVTITVPGGTYPVPFMDAVTVSGSATAMLQSPSPSPAP